MKKGIIVLLITVLAAGLVFADFSGSASINFGVSLDKKGWGFTNSQALDQYSFTFALDSQSSTKGEDHQTGVWAEISAEVYAVILADKKSGVPSPVIDSDWEITVANIHINDFTIGILGPKAAYNYATSWTNDKDTTYHTPNYNYANGDSFDHSAGGFNVSYQGYTVSFAMNNAYTAGTAASEDKEVEPKWFKDDKAAEAAGYDSSKKIIGYESGSTTEAYGAWYYVVKGDKESSASSKLTVFTNVETKAFELADGMTLQAAANFIMVGKDSKPVVGGALKYAYKADKLSLGLSTDVQFDADSKVVSLDALATGKYDFIDGAVYFGSDMLGKDGAQYVLEAKLGATIPVSEEVKVKLSAEVDDLNFANKENALKKATYKASASTTIDKLTASASMTFGKDIDKNSKTKASRQGLAIGANLEYKADKFTVKAGATVGLEAKSGKFAYYGIKPSASISTSSLVENCTLALAWSGANFVAEDVLKTASNGSINASAKISF